ncbi:serine/threonine-protein kinase [Streptomyces sp. NPDC093228]|uniref:serine/threonine-protein kinase n=1 Tax=unclassified Streptomyces TaxID=2593676 RepID=UPI001F404D74|nr:MULTISPECIES: serine/threonine-protein kinase [unclassified Streptomyces]MDX3264593.1 serine/threonine-protein kinase [Streptomyces sp. MI02-2A]
MGALVLLEDRYQLEEPLGRGAMGEVWRAADHVLNRTVAVKVLHGDDAAALERFRMEAQTAGRLSHPNVVGVYDFGSHDGRPYLVMELVDGWNLSQERSVYGVLAPREAAGIAAQMAAGLAAAHRHGVIHRDVKPANVMLTIDRDVKLTDFGIARFADAAAGALTATGKIVGSAAYLAPERAMGHSAQPASDVYSLGCVLYELLTGHPPFRGTNSLAVVQQHVEAQPAPPTQLRPDIPPALADYVMCLLSKDADGRPTADQAAAWLEAWHQSPDPAEPEQDRPEAVTLTAALPIAAEPEVADTSPRVQRRGRRKPPSKAVLGAVGVALFAGAVALGATWNGDSGRDTPTAPASSAPGAAPSASVDRTSPTGPSAGAPSDTAAPQDDQGGNDDHGGDGHGGGHGRKGKGSDD